MFFHNRAILIGKNLLLDQQSVSLRNDPFKMEAKNITAIVASPEIVSIQYKPAMVNIYTSSYVKMGSKIYA